jgi:hypothetical protein
LAATNWITNVDVLFQVVYQEIVTIRAGLGLLPMQPIGAGTTASFQIGHEWVAQNQVAPNIQIVPIGGEFDYSTTMPIGASGADQVNSPRKPIYREWAIFDAYIWGDPDQPGFGSTTPNLTFDFNSTYELRREFISAMYDMATGGSFRPDRAEWRQTSDNARFGRVYVLSFRVAVPVTQEPNEYLLYSTVAGDGGVQGVTTVQLLDPTGTILDPNTITIIAPPH